MWVYGAILGFGILSGGIGYIDSTPTTEYRSGYYYRVGVGGQYMSHSSSLMDFSAPMGSVSIEARGIMRERLQAAISAKLGYGGFSPSNNQFLQKGKSLDYDIFGRLGVNVSSKTNPLYINLTYLYTQFYGREGSNIFNKSRDSLRYGLAGVGLELEGRYKATQSLHIEYALGYSYIFAKNAYIGATDSQKLDIGNSYAITASFGYSQEINPKFLYFVRANAKYFNLGRFHNNNVESYPANKSYTVGLEIGLGF